MHFQSANYEILAVFVSLLVRRISSAPQLHTVPNRVFFFNFFHLKRYVLMKRAVTPFSQVAYSLFFGKTKACFFALSVVSTILFTANFAFSQVNISGASSANGAFTSIAAAVAALNSGTFTGPGTVLVEVDAGHSEIAPVGGIILTATGTAVNEIVFIKLGAGANPVINAYVGTNTPGGAGKDGVFVLSGSDYITIDGIDIADGNTASATDMMECGYGLFKISGTDGCNYNKIRNCTVTLNRNNNAAWAFGYNGSICIAVMNATYAASGTALTVAAASGTNSFNQFHTNTLQNCNTAIAFNGFAAPAPYTLGDTGNDVGGTSSATGNEILNFGGGAAATNPASGVYMKDQWGFNVSNNTLNNNDGGGVNHITTLRAIYLSASSLGASGNINNNTITLKSGATTSQVSCIENSAGNTGSGNVININDNFILNSTYSTASSGVFYGIYNTGTPDTLRINNNNYLDNSTNATSGTYACLWNSGAVVKVIEFDGNFISGTNLAGATGPAFYGIRNTGGAATASLTFHNNDITEMSYGGTHTGIHYFYFNSASCLGETITSNTITDVTVQTTGTVYLISNSVTVPANGVVTVQGNAVPGGFTRNATGGTFYGYYTATSSPAGSTQDISGNTFININNGTTGGTLYGIYNFDGSASPYPTKHIYDNLIINVSNGTGTSATNGIYCSYFNTGSSIDNNIVSNLTGGGIIYGIYNSSSIVGLSVHDNEVTNLTSTSTSSVVAGIYALGTTGSTENIYKNKISNLNRPAATSGQMYGLYISSGTTHNIYNNLIGEIYSPTLTGATNYLSGVYVAGGTNVNLYFNSVHISGTSSGVDFSSNAIYASTTPMVRLQNNNFVNNCTPVGAGTAVGYRRSSATLTTYHASSNNNNFYAGTPGVSNLIYADGTNTDQLLSGFKCRVGPRDGLSVTENPTFLSTVGSNPNFLHLNLTAPTQLESGAVNISGITDDYDGNIRQGNVGYSGNGTGPDIGADEGEFIPMDMSGPAISYSSPTNSICTDALTLTATITDATGVNITPGTKPRLWYKKSTEDNVLPATNTSADSGWKWVEASNASNPFSFTFNYSLLTSAVVSGDTIRYFVVAQDIVGTPNVGTNTAVYSNCGIPTSVALAAVLFPVTATNAFIILATPSPITAVAAPDEVCIQNDVTLTISGGALGAEYQWQSSPVGAGTWTNIAGANTQTYVVVDVNTSTDYRAIISCNGVPVGSSPSTIASVNVTNPLILTTTPASACGPGPVSLTLSATATAGADINWYAAATGGMPLATGASFTTPLITATTDYYVGASEGGSTANVGLPAALPTATSGAGTTNFGLVFDALSNFMLSTVTVYPVSAAANTPGTVTIDVVDGTGAILHTATVSVLGNPVASPVAQTVTLNFMIEPGTNLKLRPGARSASITGLLFEPSASAPMGNYGYPFSIPGVLNILHSTLTPPPANTARLDLYYYFYNWVVTTGCESARTPVTATIVTAPPTCPANFSVCSGDAPFTLTGGLPVGGTYSGTGVTSGTFNPASAGVGIHTITYTLCGQTCTFVITVSTSGTPTFNPIGPLCQNSTPPALPLTSTNGISGTWSPATISTTTVGSFNYVFTPAAGSCATSVTISITIQAQVTPTFNAIGPLCQGSTAPALPATSTNGIAGTWLPATISTASAGSTVYTFTPNAGQCATTATLTITINALPTVTCPANSSVCINASPITLSGGTPTGGTYSGTGVSSGIFTPSTAGVGAHTITYTFTNTNGCTASCTFTITVNALPVVSCPANSSACVNASSITLSGGTPTGGTYSGTGVSGGVFTPSTAGVGAHTITYSFTNTNGCSASCTFTITVNALPTVSCPANSSVCVNAAPITLSGGTPIGGTYSGTGVSGGVFTPSTAGVGAHTIAYSFTNGNGCTASCTFTITVNALPVVSCPANSSVCINAAPITLSGGSPVGGIYSGTGVSGGVFTPSTAGVGAHTITYSFTNGNGCTASCTFTITVNALPTVSCPANSSVCLNASPITLTGGTPTGGTYSGTGVSGGIFTPSTAGVGAHTITYSFTNGNGCSASCTFTITVNALPALSETHVLPTNCATNNGSIDLNATGAPTLTYNWTGPNAFTASTQDISNLFAGIYNVTVTDGNGCQSTLSVNIDLNPSCNTCPVIGSLSANPSPVCVNSNTTLTASGIVGVGTTYGILFKYSTTALPDPYSGGTTIATVPNASVGSTATTSTSFAASGSYFIYAILSPTPADPTCRPSATTALVVNPLPTVTCPTNSSVCVNTTAFALSGGTPTGGTYSGTGVSAGNFNPATAGVGAHTITYNYTDGNGCAGSCTFTITVNALPTVTCPANSAVCVNAPAFALSGGSPTGGTYSGNGVSGGNFNPATAGVGAHTITYSYTDGNGCTASCTFTITVNALPTVTCPASSSVCVNAAPITLTGGSPAGGTYSGTGVSGGVFTPSTAGVGAHTITYSFTNGNGCSASCTFTITVNALPTVTCPANSSVCVNASPITLTGGSPAGGTYSGTGVSGGVFTPSTAGVGAHTITYNYTDGNGCAGSCTFTITVNALPTVSCPSNSSVCVNASPITLSGGTPTGGTYSGTGISGGIFTPSTAGVGAHTITYSFTNTNGCSALCTFTITVNALPAVTCPANTSICVNGSPITLTGGSPTGGTYSGTGVSGGIFTPSTAGVGVHTITYSFTNGNGCTATCTFTITVNALPTVSCPSNSSVCINAAPITLSGGSPAGGIYSGTGVSGGVFTPATAGVGAHTITYNYTNAGGCSGSCTFTITANALPVVTCPVNSSVCVNAAAITLSGGSPTGGTYSGTGVSGGVFTPATAGAGTHTITYSFTNANGCSASCTFTITVNALPVVTCPANSSVCLNAAPFTLTGGSPAGGTYSGTGVSGGIFNPATAGLGVKTITYSFTNANGCTALCTFTITVNALPVVNITSSNAAMCVGETRTLTGTPVGGTFSATGAGSVVGTILTANSAGTINLTYTVTASGCTGTSTQSISVNSAPATFTVTGGGEFCSPGGGVPVGLSGSQVGFFYQLQRNGVNSGAPLAGTGAALNFGNQNVAGTYTVVGSFGAFCSGNMTGSAVVSAITCGITNDPTIADPCSCRAFPPTTLTNGQFDETIQVTAPAGQTWTVTAVTGLYTSASPAPPATPIAVTVGTVLTFTAPNFYRITGVHIDALGYSISVSNGLGTTLSIGNTCAYPNPVLNLDNTVDYCLGTLPITLDGDPGDNNIVSESFTINGVPATVFNPATLGLGNYVIIYTVNGGVAKAFGVSDPGCTQPVSKTVNVIATPTNLVCNDLVQVSLDQNCEATILPDMILEGTYGCFDDYTVRITPLNSNFVIANPINGDQIGKTLKVTIKHTPSGNSCWGKITVEDKLAPVLTCTNITINCAVQDYTPAGLAAIPVPGAFPVVDEPCGNYDLTYEDMFFDLACGATIAGIDASAYIKRTWTAVDESGNQGKCTQFIYFARKHVGDVLFPADIILDCAAVHALGGTDPSNTGAPYIFDFGVNFEIFPGAGLCELNSAFTDDTLPICDGSYKILRTWVVYDWCLPTSPFPPQNPIYYIQLIKILDNGGPTILEPTDLCGSTIEVSVGVFDCLAEVDLPDVKVTDNCSRLKSISASWKIDGVTYSTTGYFADFAGNNHWNPDTLGVLGTATGLPIGIHVVTYIITDDCGNSTTCTFRLRVEDQIPPTAVCVEFTQVSIGASGMALMNATSLNNGSFDNCSDVYFKARRMNSNGCQPSNQFHDQVKFCCEDIGDTILVVLRVYDVTVEPGDVSLGYKDNFINECMVQVFVDDKLKPICTPPANVTVSCEAFDPSLWAYGKATAVDNCEIDRIDESRNLANFDTLCNRGTITRTFRAFDAFGNSSACTQRIVVTYNQYYNIEFPADRVVFQCDGTTAFGEPRIDKKDCELMAISYTDEIFNVVPDACFKIERTWKIINWCTYNPNDPCVYVPNPNPNVLPNHPTNLASVIVSAPGTPAPWTATIRAIIPGGTPVDYSNFWDKDANCYEYKQIIKVIDDEDPIATDVLDDCDLTANDPLFWNSMDWWDPIHGSHDLCEAPVNINATGIDSCVGKNLTAYALIFLDLDGDGYMETVLNTNTFPTLPPGFINYNNAANPSYVGGISRQFDFRAVQPSLRYRFALRIQDLANGSRKFSVMWTDRTNPNPNNNNDWTLPQIPLGKHKIKWVISDMCGNETTKDRQWDLHDCKPPTVVCLNGLSANIMPTGMITVWGIDFLQYGDDNCTPADQLVYSIRKSGTGTGFPVDANGNPIPGVTFTCSEIGTQFVELWAKDARGNAAFCETFIQVQDPFGNCGQVPKATVAGDLKTEAAAGLEDANVEVVGTHPALPPISLVGMSNDAGHYGFNAAVPMASDFTITPVKDDNPLNGVTTYDLLLMSRHILGVTPLTSPYQQIAADVNKSGSITTNDIVELRKLILGIYTDLPNNTSWRFVDKKYNFPNPANPFSMQFPEVKSVQDLNQDLTNEDFVSIKIGDLNGNATANSLTTTDDRTNGTLLFDLENKTVKAGEVFTVKFTAAEIASAYQFTLNFNNLQILNLTPGAGLNDQNFAVFATEKCLTTSFDGQEKGSFEVKFRATATGKLSEMLSVSSRITKAEGYDLAGNRQQVALRFNENGTTTVAGVGFELYQNQPNPFVNKTVIGFNLPNATEATLTIFDETGRQIFTQKGDFGKGENHFTIEKTMLRTTGVLFYQLETASDKATRRMVQVKD